ncbi:MAG: PRC-barrel domain-containing protein [Candidatus Saccharibacteria bacterium]|nr:PRC-barrel domain-containing protein [Candidatus Saccharibacteria bacterium]
MILSQERLVGLPVIDLGLEAVVGQTTGVVIDPDDLKIVALEINGAKFLQVENIREIVAEGIAINSEEVLAMRGESVRLDKVLELDFSLIGHKVMTKKGTNLGKVLEFMINTENFLIQQIVVKRPPLKALVDAELVIGRSEITEVDDEKVIVKDEERKIREKARTEDFVPNFVNPFRQNGVFSLEKEE